MAEIIVVDYDPAWPAMFERLRARIWPGIHDVASAIEHVGSTSVPGLAAKPVIDMTIIVPDAPRMRQVIDRLGALGYPHLGDRGIPGREAFARPTGDVDHHLYACVAGAAALRNHLTLRNALWRDAALAQEYGALKKRLAQQFRDDIDGYVDGKTGFILRVLAQAAFSTNELDAIAAANRKP